MKWLKLIWLLALAPIPMLAQTTLPLVGLGNGAGGAAIPVFIQARAIPSDVSAQTGLNGTGTFESMGFLNQTQSGDKVIVFDINNQTASGSAVVTDDGSNSYSVPSGASEIAGSRQIEVHVASVTTPSHTLTDTYTSTAALDNEMMAFEFANLGAFDGACTGTATSGTAIACSSGITTTGANDIVIACANVVTFSSTPTGNMTWTKQATWSSFNPSGTDWSFCQYLTQTGAGTVTPSITVSSAVTRANIVAVAYKASVGGGSVPSTIWPYSVQSRNDHGFSTAQTATTRVEAFPCKGNDPWILTGNIDTAHVNSITDNNGNTWTGLTKVDSTGDGFEIRWWHVTSAVTCADNEAVTITYSANPSGLIPVIEFFDIANSAGYDSSATCGAGSTPCAINNTIATNPPVAFAGATITPSVGSVAHPTLILSYQNQDFDTISGVSPGLFVAAVGVCPNSGGAGCGGNGTSTSYNYVGPGFEQDSGVMIDRVTATTAVSITWTPQNTQSQGLDFSFSSTVAIKSQ